MSKQTYLKVPFVWEEPKPLVEVPSRLEFESTETLGSGVLLSALSKVIESSIDASDRKKVIEQGSQQAARRFLAEVKDGFSYQEKWWQVAINSQNEVAGFVLPAIYQNCARDGLEEATIYYIGVLPEHRGQGLAADLLLKGTRILQDVGVWRVFCDTDVNNIPMIATFKHVGYQQYSEPWRRPL